MQIITSKENKIYKSFKRLNQKKFRDREGLFVIEGDKLIGEADNIETLVIREDRAGDYDTPYVFCRELFDSLADTVSSQGVMAAARKPVPPRVIGAGNAVVMDRIQDPGNAGTIIRTAAAAGAAAVVAVKGTCDIYSPKVIRACAGAIFRIPVLELDTAETIAMMEETGKTMAAACPRDGEDMREVGARGDIALIIGNEAGGVSAAFLEKSGLRVRIPMKGDIESLNAAVAGGILIYELLY